jgi:hypothetical protein
MDRACRPGGGVSRRAGVGDGSGGCPPTALYDVLRALDYFRLSGADPDPRMAEAVEVVQSKRQSDGWWLLGRIHPGRVHFDLEGGVGAPSRWNTLRALRVLDWWDREVRAPARV